MIQLVCRGALLDIEGTISSVAYVYDVLFPYVREQLAPFLQRNWADVNVARARDLIARDSGFESFDALVAGLGSQAAPVDQLIAEVLSRMDVDAKLTGIKALQGLIWREGFESGRLQAHVFADVPPALAAWNAAGKDVRIYSSGSALAQQLFLRHSEQGDLTPWLRGYYDTRIGGKRTPDSYVLIAADMLMSPQQIVFISDVPAELEAARAAGMQTVLSIRPGNAPLTPTANQATIQSFAELQLL
jgi:enolase-phosphatase E1